jgi:catechol 2,3-dioxygenase-like lactoylglutathione lyase family enzyme
MSTTQAQPEPTDPVTLHHVALYVSDLDRTRAFYCDVLGMHEISRPADFTFPGAYFKRGTAEVHVVVESTPGRTAELRTRWSADELRTGYCVHFAFEVPSLDPYGADEGHEPRWLCAVLHSCTKPVEMRPIDPTLSREAAPLAAAPSEALPAELQPRHKGVRAVEQP